MPHDPLVQGGQPGGLMAQAGWHGIFSWNCQDGAERLILGGFHARYRLQNLSMHSLDNKHTEVPSFYPL